MLVTDVPIDYYSWAERIDWLLNVHGDNDLTRAWAAINDRGCNNASSE